MINSKFVHDGNSKYLGIGSSAIAKRKNDT